MTIMLIIWWCNWKEIKRVEMEKTNSEIFFKRESAAQEEGDKTMLLVGMRMQVFR